jgi:hypothetical protein
VDPDVDTRERDQRGEDEERDGQPRGEAGEHQGAGEAGRRVAGRKRRRRRDFQQRLWVEDHRRRTVATDGVLQPGHDQVAQQGRRGDEEERRHVPAEHGERDADREPDERPGPGDRESDEDRVQPPLPIGEDVAVEI